MITIKCRLMDPKPQTNHNNVLQIYTWNDSEGCLNLIISQNISKKRFRIIFAIKKKKMDHWQFSHV